MVRCASSVGEEGGWLISERALGCRLGSTFVKYSLNEGGDGSGWVGLVSFPHGLVIGLIVGLVCVLT